jgi:hypothetical protein
MVRFAMVNLTGSGASRLPKEIAVPAIRQRRRPIAMGDIGFSDPNKFPSMELAITGITEYHALPGRWRAILASNQVPLPIADR